VSGTPGSLHHVELWVPDLAAAKRSWGWLLSELGWELEEMGETTFSAQHGTMYVFVEQSPALSGPVHDRLAPGINHLAFHAGPRQRVDWLVEQAPSHGWSLLFASDQSGSATSGAAPRPGPVGRHPYAGGPEHYAAYLEDTHGYEVELVADPR
jgi:catechol 2,3-dioxygenase-like lactoylglutathione lyase family enzyme